MQKLNPVPKAVTDHVDEICGKLDKKHKKLSQLFRNCYPNTLQTTAEVLDDGSVFLLTGDIPAMWLRDSTAQMTQYLPLAQTDKEVAALIAGLVRKQIAYILIDPYANAFNREPNGKGHTTDQTDQNPWVWERKYEVDSLCYPLRMAWLYYEATGDTSIFDENFAKAADTILRLWTKEQRHDTMSDYRFRRRGDWKSDLRNEGKGMPTNYTGMTWSGFRPSDDACTFGYLVPSNMFASVVLGYLQTIFTDILPRPALADRAAKLQNEIDFGIKSYATVLHPKYGLIYACETDGYGNYHLFDDANVPNLLSAPYLGFTDVSNPVYQNTRQFILSDENPYFYRGKYAEGIGSPHTPKGYIWHIALSMQGLTATDENEMKNILTMLEQTDGDTGFMHEGFDPNAPATFTRPWFAWSNSLFAEFLEKVLNETDIL